MSSVQAAYVPFRLADRSFTVQAGAVILGTALLAVCSWIEVPMVPVPVTMQTFGVTLIGALYGWRLGAITVLAWLGQAMAGMPVLSGGAAGPLHFLGPTGGYLFAFPVAAALVGWLAERGWTGGNVVRSFAAMMVGNALCLAVGGAWLAAMIGWEQALILGVYPFIVGAVLKSALATATVEAMRRKGRPARVK